MTAEYVASELEQHKIPYRLLRERETHHPLNVGGDLHSPDNPKMAMLFDDLRRATVRARVGQQALAQLYLGLGAFVATSIALGVMTFVRLDAGWMPLLFGAVGVALLFSASVLLIVESRIALASAYAEMDYIRRITSHLAQPELRKTRRWRMFR